jgi:hypothetical protein
MSIRPRAVRSGDFTCRFHFWWMMYSLPDGRAVRMELGDSRAGLQTRPCGLRPSTGKIKPAEWRARNWGPIALGWGVGGDDQVGSSELGARRVGAVRSCEGRCGNLYVGGCAPLPLTRVAHAPPSPMADQPGRRTHQRAPADLKRARPHAGDWRTFIFCTGEAIGRRALTLSRVAPLDLL